MGQPVLDHSVNGEPGSMAGSWSLYLFFLCLSPTCSDFLSTLAPQIVVPRALEPGCLDSNPASATCCETLEESHDLSGLSFLYLH